MVSRQGAACLAIIAIVLMAGLITAQENANDFQMGADRGTLVMDSDDGPVGIHFGDDDRMVACQYAPVTHRAMSSTLTKFLVVIDLKSGKELSRIPFSPRRLPSAFRFTFG